jgi:hypothetical protein
MSDKPRLDIDITLSNTAHKWPAHIMHSSSPVKGWGPQPEELDIQRDEFDLDVKFDEVIGDQPGKVPFLGASGPFGITCSNTCGVLSGCAQSGCGGITCTCTCGASCGVTGGSTCGLTCGSTCGITCGDSCGGTCNGSCNDCGDDGWGDGDGD